ncbi:CIC11C00000004764 [Sungouiella intermedia]|uniref:CIC11C00000004764 n=1 Tax=Sungouiella intermedia TaxID=45354 RepID=A0A1L0BNZ4_9ASCO|nr:CIC11C00000004764 [[Candida] intermedia]
MARILFVSLISRDDKPLYIQSFDTDLEVADETIKTQNANNFLKYNFLSHMALDVFTSPISLSLKEQQQSDGVLLLFIQDDVSVYGLETNNGLKIVVGMGDEEPAMASVKTLFSNIHKRYLRTICNPFSSLGGGNNNDDLLQTASFDQGISQIVSEWALTDV